MTAVREDGLKIKYSLRKADTGEPAEGDYFVLRLDEGCADRAHLAACRAAVLAYADSIEPHMPQLATDLRAQVGEAAQ